MAEQRPNTRIVQGTVSVEATHFPSHGYLLRIGDHQSVLLTEEHAADLGRYLLFEPAPTRPAAPEEDA